MKHEQGKRAFSTVKIFWCRGSNLQTLLEYEHRAEYQQHALNKHGKREQSTTQSTLWDIDKIYLIAKSPWGSQ